MYSFPTENWKWNCRHVVLFCGWICRAVTSAVDCLDQKNECSQQATWKSVVGYFSLVYSFKHEFNVALDEKVNFDNVALVFSCLPGQFAGYVTCFFIGHHVNQLCVLYSFIYRKVSLLYSFTYCKVSLCTAYFFTGHKVNLLCVLYSFTGLEFSLLCVLYSFTGHCPDITALLTGCKTPSYLLHRPWGQLAMCHFFSGCKVVLLHFIPPLAISSGDCVSFFK